MRLNIPPPNLELELQRRELTPSSISTPTPTTSPTSDASATIGAARPPPHNSHDLPTAFPSPIAHHVRPVHRARPLRLRPHSPLQLVCLPPIDHTFTSLAFAALRPRCARHSLPAADSVEPSTWCGNQPVLAVCQWIDAGIWRAVCTRGGV